MSRRREQGTKLKDWNGHEVYVTDGGKFYVESDSEREGRIEADTLDALKKKIGKDTVLEGGLACISLRYHDESAERYTVVKVTGAGNIMVRGYRGRLERKDRFDHLYVRDDVRLAERVRLKKVRDEAEEAMQALMEEWPTVNKDTIVEIMKNPPPPWPSEEGDDD